MSAPLAVREQIYAALLSVLQAGLTPTLFPGISVERNRDAAVQQFPTVVLVDGGQTRRVPESTGFSEYTTTASIEGWVQHERSSELGPAINELYGRVLEVLFADRMLGGLAIDMSEGPLDITIDRQPNQRPLGSFAVEIDVTFWTAEDDPYSIGPGL